MKSINTLLSALFFLGAIVGITSCTEEAKAGECAGLFRY